MTPEEKKTERERQKKHTRICVWCDERFECSNSNAQTCGGRCRVRLSKYRTATGMEPLTPPRTAGASEAIAELVAQLLAKERIRRMTQAAIDGLPAPRWPEAI